MDYLQTARWSILAPGRGLPRFACRALQRGEPGPLRRRQRHSEPPPLGHRQALGIARREHGLSPPARLPPHQAYEQREAPPELRRIGEGRDVEGEKEVSDLPGRVVRRRIEMR